MADTRGSLGKLIEELKDRLSEALDAVAPRPAPVPIPVRNDPGDRRR